MIADETLELAYHPGTEPECQVGFQTLLERHETQVLEATDLVAGKRLVTKLGQGWAAPEPKPFAQHTPGLVRSSFREEVPSPVEEIFEALRIERRGFYAEQVAGRQRLDSSPAEGLAQIPDVHLHGLHGRLRRPVTPQLVDKDGCRNQLISVKQEHGENRPRLRCA